MNEFFLPNSSPLPFDGQNKEEGAVTDGIRDFIGRILGAQHESNPKNHFNTRKRDVEGNMRQTAGGNASNQTTIGFPNTTDSYDQAPVSPIDAGSEKFRNGKEIDEISRRMQLWRLCRVKYLLIFFLCRNCNNELYKSSRKFSLEDGKVNLTIGLCKSCVQRNLQASDLLTNAAPKPFNK